MRAFQRHLSVCLQSDRTFHTFHNQQGGACECLLASAFCSVFAGGLRKLQVAVGVAVKPAAVESNSSSSSSDNTTLNCSQIEMKTFSFNPTMLSSLLRIVPISKSLTYCSIGLIFVSFNVFTCQQRPAAGLGAHLADRRATNPSLSQALHANSWLALLCCVAGSVGGPATPMAKPSKSGINRNGSGSIKLSSWSELLVVLPPTLALQCRYSQCVLARLYSPQSDTPPTELVCACVCV